MSGPFLKWIVAAALCHVLLACGTSAPVSYYRLDVTPDTYIRDPEGAVVLGIGPLRIPDYLSRSQIVTRTGMSRVHVDDFNRWAEPVDDAIYRILSASVDHAVHGAIVIAFPYINAFEYEYQLVGSISRFDSDDTGVAVLEAYWSVVDLDAEIIVAPRRSRYEAPVGRAGDYESIANAMSDTLAQFGDDIAANFEAALEARAGP